MYKIEMAQGQKKLEGNDAIEEEIDKNASHDLHSPYPSSLQGVCTLGIPSNSSPPPMPLTPPSAFSIVASPCLWRLDPV